MLWRNLPDGAIPRDLDVIIGEARRSYANALLPHSSLLAPDRHGLNLNFIYIFLYLCLKFEVAIQGAEHLSLNPALFASCLFAFLCHAV